MIDKGFVFWTKFVQKMKILNGTSMWGVKALIVRKIREFLKHSRW